MKNEDNVLKEELYNSIKNDLQLPLQKSVTDSAS